MYSSIKDLREEFEERRRDLRFFDSNAWVGAPLEQAFTNIETGAELIQLMDRAIIGEALVTHNAGLKFDYAVGNKLTKELAADPKRLTPTVTLVPDGTGEIASIGDYIGEAIDGGARAARMFPKSHTFSLDPWSAGTLFDALQERRMPLILWHTEVSWEKVHSLCERYPELPIIIEGTGKKLIYDIRLFYPLLNLHKNLHIELHNLANYLVVEDIIAKFGPEQLIFGTYAPYQEPAVSMMIVTHARISEEHKRLIAGDNLRKLISDVRI